MKKVLFILLAILPILLSTGCSSDKEEELSEEAVNAKEQDEMYKKVLSNIVGHWKGYQLYYTSSIKYPVGWREISDWPDEYVFNSDGTCKEISYSRSYEGTYSIIKNENYIKYGSIVCELFLVVKYNELGISRYKIWMDGEYLRLVISVRDSDDWKPDRTDGGSASIRYKKE